MGITSAALSAFRVLIVASFKYLELGSSATAFSIAQTALISAITGNDLARAAATASAVTTTYTGDTLRLTKTWTAGGSETVREVGIFNASSDGTMGARRVLDSAYALVEDDEFTYQFDIIFAYKT